MHLSHFRQHNALPERALGNTNATECPACPSAGGSQAAVTPPMLGPALGLYAKDPEKKYLLLADFRGCGNLI